MEDAGGGRGRAGGAPSKIHRQASKGLRFGVRTSFAAEGRCRRDRRATRMLLSLVPVVWRDAGQIWRSHRPEACLYPVSSILSCLTPAPPFRLPS